MILSYTLILPMSQLQTQQLMTSQIRSHIEYLIHTNCMDYKPNKSVTTAFLYNCNTHVAKNCEVNKKSCNQLPDT